jgi:hypothetical protein
METPGENKPVSRVGFCFAIPKNPTPKPDTEPKKPDTGRLQRGISWNRWFFSLPHSAFVQAQRPAPPITAAPPEPESKPVQPDLWAPAEMTLYYTHSDLERRRVSLEEISTLIQPTLL